MARVEPVPDAPAATADLDDETALLVADYHAGIETGLRYERGVELDSAADARRERLCGLLDDAGAGRLVVLGDLGHRIGDAGIAEREEVSDLLAAVDVPVTLAPGNHDPGVAEAFGDRIEVTPATGAVLGDVGILHGHTWPDPALFAADVICMGHEHPAVKLADEVGTARAERAWLRGPLAREPFETRCGELVRWNDPELVVFPAFNDRSGSTWVNVPGQRFLSPFLPSGFASAEAYLLDGTRLGPYREV